MMDSKTGPCPFGAPGPNGPLRSQRYPLIVVSLVCDSSQSSWLLYNPPLIPPTHHDDFTTLDIDFYETRTGWSCYHTPWSFELMIFVLTARPTEPSSHVI